MAKIKLSAIGITAISGKIGGTIFSKNKGGIYVKNYTKPSNPMSEKQTGMRRQFGFVASLWKTLTEPQKLGWKQKGLEMSKSDVFGDQKNYTARGAFVAVNYNRLHGGFAEPILDAGQLSSVVIPDFKLQYVGGGDMEFVCSTEAFDLLPDGGTVLFASIGVVASETSFNQQVVTRQRYAMETDDFEDSSPADGTSKIEINIAGLLDGAGKNVGDKVLLSIHYHTADGQKSAEQTVSFIR